MEEASKFLPPSKPLVIDLDKYNLPSNSHDTSSSVVIKEEIVETDNSFRSRKHYQIEDNGYAEERSSKQSAIYVEEDVLSEMFDRVVLCTDSGGPSLSSCEELQKNGQSYGYSNEQLKQIRQHASPTGDAPQRLAHIFASGLVAHLAGTGSQLYATRSAMTISAAEKLKGYQVYLSACPFKKIAIFIANKMIYDAASTSSTLHIVDFGIAYGFQWPILIKHLSERPGGPPKLRITGIEFPKPGFRPAEGVEEPGRCLANLCAKYNVPFEYNAIATQNWEMVKVEYLKLQRNEFIAVNTLIRFKNLLDDSEALFHFSSMFDMFDATLDRDDEQRLNFEKEFCGREAMNEIACEGGERVERPETYKQCKSESHGPGSRMVSGCYKDGRVGFCVLVHVGCQPKNLVLLIPHESQWKLTKGNGWSSVVKIGPRR
ncbi:hypothetical protein L1987_30199 [Smallanthus sonchifolius]|uniref:Uncharacterized protein n=1 Tax=Smallanthus sonchifolius TaxID=185202 RepID=A0ACB9I1J2_9ASTR|nr:hypothetical protein L1987_30199 [Smallanthus sonchifolius]